MQTSNNIRYECGCRHSTLSWLKVVSEKNVMMQFYFPHLLPFELPFHFPFRYDLFHLTWFSISSDLIFYFIWPDFLFHLTWFSVSSYLIFHLQHKFRSSANLIFQMPLINESWMWKDFSRKPLEPFAPFAFTRTFSFYFYIFYHIYYKSPLFCIDFCCVLVCLFFLYPKGHKHVHSSQHKHIRLVLLSDHNQNNLLY